MSQNVAHGGLWGDFTIIFWISQYLQRPIYVWCKTSVQILMKCGKEYYLTLVMYLTFGNQHSEPIQYITSSHLQHEFLEFKKKKVQRKPFNSTKRKTIFL
jgi:hypothetical protein